MLNHVACNHIRRVNAVTRRTATNPVRTTQHKSMTGGKTTGLIHIEVMITIKRFILVELGILRNAATR